MENQVFWCSSCLNMSTRPRISFNEKGQCNACTWSEEKKTFDWEKRKKELKNNLEKYNAYRKNGYGVIVAVSGGKDGSYVAYKLREEYKVNPLCVTVRPPLELEIGQTNVVNFINSGFNHIHVTPDQEAMRALDKHGFIEMGFPYYGWLISIHTVIWHIAVMFGIKLIFYSEDGEVEYGGSTEKKNISTYDMSYQRDIYLESGYEQVLKKVNLPASQLFMFNFPKVEDCEGKVLTHWSYYEPWDSYRNYLIAKEHCGLIEPEETNTGTFTNFAQNDQALYALHAYLMYLKFGFGRGTQDAGIEIRRGAMTRDQAINLVKLYDNNYPENFLDLYLDYYEMNAQEFNKVIDKWANKDLFEKKKGRWMPKFEII
ncbi:MAG: legionaminic acid biosynthesis protein PtmG [Gammaproteobacteria bacterium]|nr:legionaminic acid biosynthesis protein PtmG [Gammaproteobacteria bacterium]